MYVTIDRIAAREFPTEYVTDAAAERHHRDCLVQESARRFMLSLVRRYGVNPDPCDVAKAINAQFDDGDASHVPDRDTFDDIVRLADSAMSLLSSIVDIADKPCFAPIGSDAAWRADADKFDDVRQLVKSARESANYRRAESELLDMLIENRP